MNNEIANKIVWFCEQVNKAMEIHWKKNNFTFNSAPKIMVEKEGPKYVKLVECEQMPNFTGPYKSKCVYCFIDKTNGDLLKGTWKAPVAKGVRGNLFDTDILSKVTPYGTVYLRGGGNYGTIASLLA